MLMYLTLRGANGLAQVQNSLLKNSLYLIDNEQVKSILDLKDTLLFKKNVEQTIIPKFSTLWLKFHLNINVQHDSTVFINCNQQGYVKLFQISENTLKFMGETGFVSPYHRRSIRDDISTIRLILRKGESKDFILQIKNFTIQHDILSANLYDYAKFQELKIAERNTFISRFGQPIFLGIVVLILLFTLFQCVLFREKIYFIYLLYIILILLRVAMGISLLVVEDFVPPLRSFGFISRFSQSFSFLSIITYLFFIREFTQIPLKAPKFDKFIRFQIIFTGVVLVLELFMVVEKYTVPRYISFYNGLELIQMILSIITIWGLIKLYDRQNKYLVLGVSFLFLVAFVGQQIIGRVSSLSRMEQDVYLQISWGVAYLGEMIFFTVGLFSRGIIMKETIEKQTLENQKLVNELIISRKKDATIQPETLSIATIKGTIILQQSDIYRIEASGNYTIFHVQNHKQVVASYSMAEFEDKLNTVKFLRVHKSHIINLQYINKYTRGDGGSLTLHDGTEIPVSRSRKEDLIKILFTDN